MSAILDLDQIACSGNGVVSDKCILPVLTHLAGSLQQGVLVKIRYGGRCAVSPKKVTAAGTREGKAGGGLSWLGCHHLQEMAETFGFFSPGSC